MASPLAAPSNEEGSNTPVAVTRYFSPSARVTGKLAITSSAEPLLPGAIPRFNSTSEGSSIKGVAVLNSKSSMARSPLMYTSTNSAAGSAALWITCTMAGSVSSTTCGNSITVPSAKAANSPKAAPSWLAEGSRNPEANTTAAPPPSEEILASKEATTTSLALPGVTSRM